MTIEFLATALIIAVIPGTGALFTLAAGITRGLRASLVAALGCTLGVVPHAALAISGAAVLIATSDTAFAVLKYAGVAYLIVMAWSTLRSASEPLTVESSQAALPSDGRTVLTAVGINLLNPKLTVFFLAFLPQFVPVGTESAVPRMLELSVVFMVITFGVFAGYGLGAAAVRDLVVTRPRVLAWTRRVFAISFLGLGARLALTAR